MPSAVSPRATAVRMPGSSSTTSTRAITADATPHAMRVLSGRMDDTLSVMTGYGTDGPAAAQQRRIAAGDRASRASVGLGLLAVPAGAGAQPALAARRAGRPGHARCWQPNPARSSGTVELDNELGLPALPDAAAGRATAPAPRGCGPTARTAAGSSCPPTGRAHAGLRRHDVLGVELRGPHGRRSGTRQGRPRRPTPGGRPDHGRHRGARRAAPTSDDQRRRHRRGRGPPGLRAGAGARSPPSARCCARCGSPSTPRSGCRCGSPCWRNGSTDPALQVGFTELTFGAAGPGAVHVHPAARAPP